MKRLSRKLAYHYRDGGVTGLIRKVGGLARRKCWSESQWVIYVRELKDDLPEVPKSVERRELGLPELRELGYFKVQAFPEEIELRFARSNICHGFYSEGQLATMGWTSPNYLELDQNVHFPCSGAAGLFDFVTFEEFRARGYYTNALMQLAIVMRQAGFASAHIAVDPGNTPSIKGIERAGFGRLVRVTRRWRFGVTSIIQHAEGSERVA